MLPGVVKQRSAVMAGMWRWLEQAKDSEQIERLELLGRVPLFTTLSRRQLAKLSVRLYEKAYPAGETIFVEGDRGKALFIVLKGRVGIWRTVDGREEMLVSLGCGTYFGELALIDDEPRFATARAEEPAVLLILYKTDFDHLIEGHSRIAVRVMSNLLKTLAVYVRRDEARQRRQAAGPTHNAPDGRALGRGR